jgi:hypothetical protein
MKVLLKIVGGVLVFVILALVVLRVTGLNPHERTPGLWLTGNLNTSPVPDWSFTDNTKTVKVQTNSWYLLPHSVTTFCIAANGQLYLATTKPETRAWTRNVARDPHVRLKIGDQLFDRTLSPVTDPGEKESVLQARAKKYAQKYPPPGGVDAWSVFHVVPE